ncbi:hypothetical protein ATANTOWER_027418 [Ataeniobius toweri]|uniref:SH3 domain-containing protein n=1 Tax=Ataeniobius toweri TaxID=208326 RepID=A0ABU7B2Z3_9TELE|nr:hypothetical protein [Ataeniobius toweri]
MCIKYSVIVNPFCLNSVQAELTFSAGDIIHVFGDMDEDGFFYGELNGHRGLVPSNFLQALPDEPPPESLSSGAQSAPEPRKESQVIKSICPFNRYICKD